MIWTNCLNEGVVISYEIAIKLWFMQRALLLTARLQMQKKVNIELRVRETRTRMHFYKLLLRISIYKTCTCYVYLANST